MEIEVTRESERKETESTRKKTLSRLELMEKATSVIALLHGRASCTGTISRIPRCDRVSPFTPARAAPLWCKMFNTINKSLTLHARASCTRARIPAGVKTVIFLPDNGRGGTRPPWIDPNRSKNRTKPNQNEPTRDARE